MQSILSKLSQSSEADLIRHLCHILNEPKTYLIKAIVARVAKPKILKLFEKVVEI